jgi:hypothetical protein
MGIELTNQCSCHDNILMLKGNQMSALNKVIRPTEAVRRLMRAHGAAVYRVFTNKYDTCRTVKCYTRDIDNTDQFERDLLELYQELELGCPQMHYTTGQGVYHGASSLIVRIPFSLQSK